MVSDSNKNKEHLLITSNVLLEFICISLLCVYPLFLLIHNIAKKTSFSFTYLIGCSYDYLFFVIKLNSFANKLAASIQHNMMTKKIVNKIEERLIREEPGIINNKNC